ncbi:MAG: HD domain-containing protein [Acidobacteria bacterium]|nr:HD domain-containing protein [Acidobacteriota bacterium]
MKLLLRELEPNKVYTTSFLVQQKEIRQKKTGEPYLSLLLSDRTGEVDAKMWDNVTEVIDAFDRDDFVKVKGLLQVYHNRPQLTLHKVRRLNDGEVDFADYFPCSERDPGEMWRELRELLASVGQPHLKALLEALLEDPEIARRLLLAPAAKHIHHAYLGGLLEHILSVAHLARLTASRYPEIDLDLLLAGVVLHDLGKIHELSYDRGFGYTPEGQLLGHMAIGLRMVAAKIRGLPDFPPRLHALLEHMILSHHGQLEFGSPKLPQFPEALLLHYLDDMDSKLAAMRALIAKDRQVEGCFTGYSTSLARMVLKRSKFLEGPVEQPPSGVAEFPLNPPAAPGPEARPASDFGGKLAEALGAGDSSR